MAYECTNAKFSPIRFLYASEFNVDAANAVILKLKDPTKDANDMTLLDAHKRMGPCYDFGLSAMAAVAVCDNACLQNKCAVTPDSKTKSQALSKELKAITDKWDGKAAAPLSDAQVCVCLCLLLCVNVCECDCDCGMCVCTDVEVSGAQYQVMAEFVAWMKQLPSQVLLGG